jgi:hypothetical protein
VRLRTLVLKDAKVAKVAKVGTHLFGNLGALFGNLGAHFGNLERISRWDDSLRT